MAARYLGRSRIVAPPGWSRWLVPPVAFDLFLQQILHLRPGSVDRAVLAGGPRVRRHRRDWPGYQLHLPAIHADHVVPRSTGLGHRYRDHGFWRRGTDRVAVANSMPTAFGATGAHPDLSGIAKAFLIHGVGYAVFMSVGGYSSGYRPTTGSPRGGRPRRSRWAA